MPFLKINFEKSAIHDFDYVRKQLCEILGEIIEIAPNWINEVNRQRMAKLHVLKEADMYDGDLQSVRLKSGDDYLKNATAINVLMKDGIIMSGYLSDCEMLIVGKSFLNKEEIASLISRHLGPLVKNVEVSNLKIIRDWI